VGAERYGPDMTRRAPSPEQPAEPATSIEIVHRFDAPPAAVWQAWTDPAVVRRWWGSDPNGVVTSAVLDVRAGGRFEISFRDPDGTRHTSRGAYLRVDAPAVLELTWSWASEPGVGSRVTVELEGDDRGTAMRFVHGDLRGASEHDYATGWRRTFAKLDDVLAGRR
jgi:uncharacterized protein YndB with AHSA1/START domain